VALFVSHVHICFDRLSQSLVTALPYLTKNASSRERVRQDCSVNPRASLIRKIVDFAGLE
jgi:hypothetical protein